jgi:hypothetical protein
MNRKRLTIECRWTEGLIAFAGNYHNEQTAAAN